MLERIEFEAALAEGHRFRSELIDLFASIEEWVVNRSNAIGMKTNNAPLGQRVKWLSTNKVAFKYPKRIDELTAQVNAALGLRNEIVHSRLTTLRDSNNEAYWLFSNVTGGDPARPLCLNRTAFKQHQTELKRLIKMLNDQALKATTPAAPAISNG